MLDVLPGSKVPRQAGSSRGMASAVMHVLVIAGAIRVTAQEIPERAGPVEVRAIYIQPVAPTPAPAVAEAVEGDVAPVPSVELPPAPTDMPTSIPPVTLGPVLDPARLRATLSSGETGARAGDPIVRGRAFAEAEVDEAVQVVQQPSPRYPPALQQALIEGKVVVEFVIDTTGQVERGSLRVTASTRKEFEAAALEAIEASLFRPARVGGQVVRQRTSQSIVFRIRS